MTDQPAATVTLLANPPMEEIHHGIAIASLGDDGDLIALGHHDDDKARAAFRSHLGLSLDDEPIRRGWAIFRKPEPGNEEEAEYWWMSEEASADTPGALAVTYLEL